LFGKNQGGGNYLPREIGQNHENFGEKEGEPRREKNQTRLALKRKVGSRGVDEEERKNLWGKKGDGKTFQQKGLATLTGRTRFNP